MVARVYDTNILIDFLRGIAAARQEVEAATALNISIVTWIETLSGAPPAAEEATRRFLSRFDVVPLSPEVAELAITARARFRLKLPDAVILATAQALSAELVTRDEKAFASVGAGVRFPYALGSGDS